MPKVVITEESLPDVLEIITTWEGKMTWDLVCAKVADHLSISDGVKRQCLSGYLEIQKAYSKRKEVLREGKQQMQGEEKDFDLEYFKNQLAVLKSKLCALEEKNNAYKERFIRWQYNAYLYGMRVNTLDNKIDTNSSVDTSSILTVLDAPLPAVNRRDG